MRTRERSREPASGSKPARTAPPGRASLVGPRASFEAGGEPAQERPRKSRSITEQLEGAQRMGSFLERLLGAPAGAQPGTAGRGAEGAIVQAKSRSARPVLEPEPEEIHEAAAEGIRGPGGALPHVATIQRSFGRFDVSHVKAHTDGPAAAAARSMRAEAFTTGEHVAFAGAPSLRTAAHEAAHAVQQRADVQLQGGVGEVGDRYERQADAVADRVVQGASAEALLEQAGAPGASSRVQRRPAEVQQAKASQVRAVQRLELPEAKETIRDDIVTYIEAYHQAKAEGRNQDLAILAAAIKQWHAAASTNTLVHEADEKNVKADAKEEVAAAAEATAVAEQEDAKDDEPEAAAPDAKEAKEPEQLPAGTITVALLNQVASGGSPGQRYMYPKGNRLKKDGGGTPHVSITFSVNKERVQIKGLHVTTSNSHIWWNRSVGQGDFAYSTQGGADPGPVEKNATLEKAWKWIQLAAKKVNCTVHEPEWKP